MGDEIDARRDLYFFTDRGSPVEVMNWLREYMAVGAPAHVRVRQSIDFALHGKDSLREAFRNTCEVAKRFAQRLGMSEEVQTALLSVFELWDGGGPNGARGDLVPITSRIVYATSFLGAFHHMGGRQAAIHLAEQRRGKAFDPTVVDAFLSLSKDDRFWEGLERESVWRTVLAMEPQSPHRYLREEKLEDVALAFADFTDLKSFYTAGHSRGVGDLAEGMARQMRLPPGEAAVTRRRAIERAVLAVGDELAPVEDGAVLDDVRVAEVDVAAPEAQPGVRAIHPDAEHPLVRQISAVEAAAQRGLHGGAGGDVPRRSAAGLRRVGGEQRSDDQDGGGQKPSVWPVHGCRITLVASRL